MVRATFVCHPPGVCETEAETRCGGAQRLKAAVEAGEVRSDTSTGLKLYFFPRVRIGEVESAGTSSSATGSKDLNDKTFKALQESLHNLGSSICSDISSTYSLMAFSSTC